MPRRLFIHLPEWGKIPSQSAVDEAEFSPYSHPPGIGDARAGFPHSATRHTAGRTGQSGHIAHLSRSTTPHVPFECNTSSPIRPAIPSAPRVAAGSTAPGHSHSRPYKQVPTEPPVQSTGLLRISSSSQMLVFYHPATGESSRPLFPI